MSQRTLLLAIVSAAVYSMDTSGHAATFDYTNSGPVLNADIDQVLEHGILSTATTTGGQLTGPLHIDADGYGVRGNLNDELNNDENIDITFSEAVFLDWLLLTESNGAANDLIELRVDGASYDFLPEFGSNHPLEMTSRATSTGTSFGGNPVNLGWLLDFTGLDIAGQTFIFAIPEEAQSQFSGGDYQIGGVIVRPIPEPASLVLTLLALGIAGYCRRK